MGITIRKPLGSLPPILYLDAALPISTQEEEFVKSMYPFNLDNAAQMVVCSEFIKIYLVGRAGTAETIYPRLY